MEALRLRCIRTDNDQVRYQPRPCDAAAARVTLGALHPDVELVAVAAEGDALERVEGVLRWPIR